MDSFERRAFCIGLTWLTACGGGGDASADDAPLQAPAAAPPAPQPAPPAPQPAPSPPAPGPGPSPSPSPAQPPVPNAGLYASVQFATSQLQRHVDVEFSRRPNAGSQFTSEITRVAEQNSRELSLKLDLAVPPNASAQRRQPLIVWLHGGGLVSGGKEEMVNQMLSFARAGYVAASVNYRLTPGNETSVALRVRALQHAAEDAMNAIRFLKVNAATYGIDPDRIATFGNSAGGTLSLVNAIEFDTLATTVSDFPGVSSRVHGAVSTGAALVDGASSADVLLHYDSGDTPVLLYHANPTDGTSEATWSGAALPTQSRINASGNSCTVVAQPDRSHTVDLSVGGAYWAASKPFLWARLRLSDLR